MKILLIAAVVASAAGFAGTSLMGRSAAGHHSAQQLAGNSNVLPSQRPAYLAVNLTAFGQGSIAGVA